MPADGAENVLVLTPVSISFSEQLDPASVSSSTLRLELANAQGHGTSAFVVGTVTLVDGRTVSFAPSLPLLPNRHFIARFAGGVFDTGGTPYQDGPVTWTFTTSTVVAPGGQVYPERFHIGMPESGVVEIWGEPGAVPTVQEGQTHWAVAPYLAGPVADPTLDTFMADSVGGFTGHAGHPPDFPVDITSEVWVKVLDPTGTAAAEFRLGPMTTPDGRGFVAPAGEPTTFSFTVGPDDFPYDVPLGTYTVEVPDGAFQTPTLVRITPLDPATVGVDTPTGMALGAFINVDFDGEAAETLRVKIPAPAGHQRRRPGLRRPADRPPVGEEAQVPRRRRRAQRDRRLVPLQRPVPPAGAERRAARPSTSKAPAPTPGPRATSASSRACSASSRAAVPPPSSTSREPSGPSWSRASATSAAPSAPTAASSSTLSPTSSSTTRRPPTGAATSSCRYGPTSRSPSSSRTASPAG